MQQRNVFMNRLDALLLMNMLQDFLKNIVKNVMLVFK